MATQKPIGVTPLPRLSPMWFDNVMHLVERIWEQWFVGLIAAVNLTPGNSTPFLFANLPDPPVEGMFLVISDSTVNTWGTAITIGGGGFRVGAYFNGTQWTVAAK